MCVHLWLNGRPARSRFCKTSNITFPPLREARRSRMLTPFKTLKMSGNNLSSNSIVLVFCSKKSEHNMLLILLVSSICSWLLLTWGTRDSAAPKKQWTFRTDDCRYRKLSVEQLKVFKIIRTVMHSLKLNSWCNMLDFWLAWQHSPNPLFFFLLEIKFLSESL